MLTTTGTKYLTIQQRKLISGKECDSLSEEKNNRKPNPLTKTMLHRSNIYYSKIYMKENWKKNIQFPLEHSKLRPPKYLTQLSIWKGGLVILDIDSQLNSLKIKYIQRLPNFFNGIVSYYINWT